MAKSQFRSSKVRLIASLSAVALAATGIVATASSANADSRTGGTLYYITNADSFAHADPTRVYTGVDIAFLNTYLFRTLLSYNPTVGQAGFQLKPDLATDTGRVSDGGKTWAFTLKSGIKWEDGSPLTCADEKYGVSRAFATDVLTDGPTYAIQYLDIPTEKDGSSAYKGPYKKTGQALFDKAVVCNGNTITFHLNAPIGDFNYFGTYPAMSPVKASADKGDKYDMSPMALGPYKIKSYKSGAEMVLVRNPNWSAATDSVRTAYPDQVIMRFSISEDVRDQIFLKDSTPNAVNYDQAMQPANQAAFFNASSTAGRGMNVTGPYTRYYATNVTPGHMDCLDVRKAVFFAVNNKALIDLAGGVRFYGKLGDSVINPLAGIDYAATHGGIHDSNFNIAGNPTYAKSVLADAAKSCPDTYARVTDPKKGINWDVANTATGQKAATLIKTALNAAGIQVNFNFIPSAQYYPTVQNPAKQGDISTAGWGADWANASTVIPPLTIKEGGFDEIQNWNWTGKTTADPGIGYDAWHTRVVANMGQTDRAKQSAEWKALAQVVTDEYWAIRPLFSMEQEYWGSKVGGASFWLPQGALLFPALYVKQ